MQRGLIALCVTFACGFRRRLKEPTITPRGLHDRFRELALSQGPVGDDMGTTHKVKVSLLSEFGCDFTSTMWNKSVGEPILFVKVVNSGVKSSMFVNVYPGNSVNAGEACLDMQLFEGEGFCKSHIENVKAEPHCPLLKGDGIMRFADSLARCFRQKSVTLDDASYLVCSDLSEVPLGMFRTFTRGQTFYEKYGFVAESSYGDPAKTRLYAGIRNALHTMSLIDFHASYCQCSADSPCGDFQPAEQQGGILSFSNPRNDTIVGHMNKYRDNAKGAETLAGFFEWLYATDCPAVKTAMLSVKWPCKAYPNDYLEHYAELPNLHHGDHFLEPYIKQINYSLSNRPNA